MIFTNPTPKPLLQMTLQDHLRDLIFDIQQTITTLAYTPPNPSQTSVHEAIRLTERLHTLLATATTILIMLLNPPTPTPNQ
jgi:hypothetical protein